MSFKKHVFYIQVEIFSLAKEKHIKDALETEVVEDIWSSDPDADHFYALCSTGHQLSVFKVQVPTGKVLEKLKVNPQITIPDDMSKIKAEFETVSNEDQDKVILKSVYFVTKKGQNDILSARSNLTGKKLGFGQVFHWDANSEIVARIKLVVNGKPDLKLEVSGM